MKGQKCQKRDKTTKYYTENNNIFTGYDFRGGHGHIQSSSVQSEFLLYNTYIKSIRNIFKGYYYNTIKMVDKLTESSLFVIHIHPFSSECL